MLLRILLVAMEPLLAQIVENAIGFESGMMIVGSVKRLEQAHRAASRLGANVLIISENESLTTDHLVRFLKPKRLVFVIDADGRRATRCRLNGQAIREQPIDDLSANNLVAAIHIAAKEANWQDSIDKHQHRLARKC
jgi:hypothetical protein